MKLHLIILFAGAVFFNKAVKAQSTTASQTFSLSISNALELSFTQGGSGVSLVFDNASEYASGITAASAAVLQVKSNRSFNVSVKSAAANFTSSSATTMPVNNILFVKENSQSSFINLSTTNQTLLSGQTKGSKTISLTYRANPGFSYDGGNYTISIIYTATQQ